MSIYSSSVTAEIANNSVTLNGALSKKFSVIKKESVGRYDCWFGDAKKVAEKCGTPLTPEQIKEIYTCGHTESFYEKVWGYFCVNPSDYTNYMFPLQEGENRDADYIRLRMGVYLFHKECKYNVYIIPSG